ncbi:MAG: hypothetical protein NZO58_04505 [Gemmataceae bacterium]|nr:hypothetical protein [Gemmataceae bacterium]
MTESGIPLDPYPHAQVSSMGNLMINVRVNGKMLHLGAIQTALKFDGRVLQPGAFGRVLGQNQPLPRQPGRPARRGFMSVYEINKVEITQLVEVVATKPPKAGDKRRLDAVLVRYLIDNKDSQPHEVGVRVWMDMYIVDNDGALFAAPNRPKQVLDGVELRDKDVPDYVQVLQRPDLNNPGFVAHFSYNLGWAFERPNRVVMTNLGGAFGDGWNMQVMQAMGDSAYGFYWDPKPIAPGKRRSLAYGYGQGLCGNVDEDGHFTLALSGSFEPGKSFTIAAQVQDVGPGQYLCLELPPGMELIEGRELQPVGSPDDSGNAMVTWKARVLQPGKHVIRVRSNSGVTQGKIVTITP